MTGPFDDLTPAQRQQIREAHARGRQSKPHDDDTCSCCGAALVRGEPIYITDEHLKGGYLPGRAQCSANCGGVPASEVSS